MKTLKKHNLQKTFHKEPERIANWHCDSNWVASFTPYKWDKHWTTFIPKASIIFYENDLLTHCRWMKSPSLHVCFPLLHMKETSDLHGLRYVHHSHSCSSDNNTEDDLLTACSLLSHVESDDHSSANLKTVCCPSLTQVEQHWTASYSKTKSPLWNEMP